MSAHIQMETALLLEIRAPSYVDDIDEVKVLDWWLMHMRVDYISAYWD